MSASFADVIDAFGGPAAFAREVGMTAGAAKQARRRDSLSARWFGPTAEAAKKRGLAHITERQLSAIARRPSEAQEAA